MKVSVSVVLSLIAMIGLLIAACASGVPHRYDNVKLQDILVDINQDFLSVKSRVYYRKTVPLITKRSVFGKENIAAFYDLPSDPGGGQGHLVHEIYKYDSSSQAIEAFNILTTTEMLFNKEEQPTWWAYVSPAAEQWRGACHGPKPYFTCELYARYGEVTTYVTINFLPTDFTTDEWVELVKIIDKKITAAAKPALP